MRFGGSGSSTPGKDRILIPVDPNNAVDVGGADFTIEFWMAGTPADNAGGSPGCGGGVGWINGRIIMDRDRVGFLRSGLRRLAGHQWNTGLRRLGQRGRQLGADPVHQLA